jgi:hypothetical protein
MGGSDNMGSVEYPAKERRPMVPVGGSVQLGEQCQAHIGIVKEIVQLQGEVLHMKNEFGRMATGVEKLVEKLEADRQDRGSPEITKAFIVGLFGLFGGGITVVVALITNADKLSKLIGWGG